MGKKLSPMHEKLRDGQIDKNVEYISKIDALLEEIEPFNKKTLEYINELEKLYNTLDKSHGMLVQGKYANMYTTHFGVPSTPIFDLYSEISSEFSILDEHTKDNFMKDLPVREEFLFEFDNFLSKVKPIFEDASAENSIILRFEGMEEIYYDLKKTADQHWSYPKQLAIEKALHNREFIEPLFFHGIPKVNPFHVEIYINYSPILNSGLIIRKKLQNLKYSLKTINAQLPFAELNEKVPQIQNIVSGIDKSTTIGENTKIGENNAIGDNASIK
ncbi:hypothetical protein [Paenibacillus sp. AGC30]